MLKIHDLCVSYGDKTILDNVSLEIPKGETLALVGESGTGKTTLGLSVMGIIANIAGNVSVTGKIEVGGRDLYGLPPEERRSIQWNNVSMVFQNVSNALNPSLKVLRQVKEPLDRRSDFNRKEAEQRALDVLDTVGLPERCYNKYPHQLSIGERQRALLGMAFVCDPELVILDEPTSALDMESKQHIVRVIHELGRGRTILLITHDLSVAAEISDRTAVLYGGGIVEIAPSTHFINQPRHPYSRGLIRSFPDMARTRDLQGIKGNASQVGKGCPFEPRCTQSLPVCRTEKPVPVSMESSRTDGSVACHRGGVVPVLTVSGLSKSFENHSVLTNVDLSLYDGETLAVVGRSGEGKTTLARIIMGILDREEGNITMDGEPVNTWNSTFYESVQMVFQNPADAVSHRMNVYDAVMEPLNVQKKGTKEWRREKVKALLEEVQLPADHEFLHRYPHELSGGEAQRVVIARALALEPRVLVADEPTSALDCSVQAKIIKLLDNLQETRGLSILFITHDLALARKISDRIAILNDGRIIESGNTSAIFANPRHPHTRKLLTSAPVLLKHAN
jgi:peptide/nickel transport system ATP-binding protein